MKKAFVFGGGVYDGQFPVICPEDFIIAADAGHEILEKHGITPHITVGDFDSSEKIPSVNVIKLPVEKDVTDTYAAVNIALEKGCDEIYIYGGMGGRPDHTFANYTLIAQLSEKGIKAFLCGEGYVVTAVCCGKISLEGKKGKTVSVFSWSEKCGGVSLTGLKYALSDAVLTNSFALGVSNSFEAEKAEISVKNGTLVIMTEL